MKLIHVQCHFEKILQMKVHLDNINWLILSEGDDQWSHGAEFMGHYGIGCCASSND